MIFLYGIIQESQRKEWHFLNDGAIPSYTIPFQGLSGVVSPAHLDFSQKLPKEVLIKSLIQHQKFLEELMKTYDVIPFKFGTSLKDENDLTHLLKFHYETFKRLLSDYKNQCEISLSAVWINQQSVFDELLLKDQKLAELKEKIQENSLLEDRVKLGKKLQESLLSNNERVALEISQGLTPISVKTFSHEKVNDFMLYHVSHLLPKNGLPKFYEALEKLNQTFQGKIQFRAVGPLPPYSFATVHVNVIPATQIKEAHHILGIHAPTGFSEIKKAHQQLAAEHHPDQNPKNVKKFEEVRGAYRLLSQCYKEVKNLSLDQDFIGIEVKAADQH